MTEPEERPYRDHSENELDNELRTAESGVSYSSREYKAARQAGDRKEMADWDNTYQSWTRIHSLIRRERQLRREEKAALRQQNGSSASGAALGDDALAGYFNATGANPPPAIKTSRVDYDWKLGDHYYRGTYLPKSRTLKVWIQVQAGTPGATRFGRYEYLPANNRAEIAQALEAEKRVR